MNSIVKLIIITLSWYYYSLYMLLQPLSMILWRKKLSSSNSTKDQSVFTVGQDVNRQNMVKNYVNKDIFYKILKDYPGTATLVFYTLISPIINSYISSRTVAVSIPGANRYLPNCTSDQSCLSTFSFILINMMIKILKDADSCSPQPGAGMPSSFWCFILCLCPGDGTSQATSVPRGDTLNKEEDIYRNN